MKSWVEEFERRYNKPRMDNITVGFSGIDPAPKGNVFNPETPEEEQAAKSFIQEQVNDCLSVIDITIDGGEIE